MKNSFLILAALCGATLSLLSGCATPSTSQGMTTTAMGITQKHSQTVAVAVTGGKDTSAAGASQISNENFAEAIKASITSSGVFAQVLGADAADYRIDVFISRLQQPIFGASMTVTFEANWTLTRKSDGKVVWQKGIPTTHTAKFGEAFAGVTRLRLANEGAAKENIEAAIKAMAELNLN